MENNDSPPTTAQLRQALAEQPVRDGQLVLANASQALVVASNIDMGTWVGRCLLMAASNPGDYEPDKNGEVRILATQWLVYADSGVDEETGEVREFSRTVLFDRIGQTFRTTAAHAPQRMRGAMQAYSSDEWARGIPFIIRVRRGKRGRDYHDIRVDRSEPS